LLWMLSIFVGVVALFSALFHLLMLREGQDFSWFTGVYWTLTVMSTLGFGDITFHSDLGRLFSVVVLLSGTMFMLVLLPFTFLQFFWTPWMEAQAAGRRPRHVDPGLRDHVVITQHDAMSTALIERLTQFQYSYVLVEPDVEEATRLAYEGLSVIAGDLDDPDTYERARVSEAALVVAARSDEMNAQIASTVRAISDVPIIGTADVPASVDILELAGCTQVLQLADMLGDSLARRATAGDSMAHVIGEFEDLLIAEATVTGTPMVGQTLIEADLRVAATITDVRTVERLLLCQLYLRDFVNNFVSFPELYSRTERALFELGVVVMDGRRFNFVLPVPDPAAHSTVAKASNLLVLYLEISGDGTEKFSAAVPVTSGTKGNLGVGKRGIFFNIRGREFDARVTNILENPVSIREALCMPFVRLWRLLEGKIESWSLTAEKQLQAQFDKSVPIPGATTVTASPEPGTLSAAQKGGLVMGLSVAAAALGSAFAFITKQLAGLEKLQIGLGLLGAALVVVLPITLIAVLKLRRQDLSSLLEGCGWAVNARMRLSSSQRRHFTSRPPFPAAAAGTPRHHWRLALLIAMLVLLGTNGTCRLRRQRQARPEPEQAIPAKQPGAVPAANPEAGSGP